jgi:hypothetical protein
LQVESLENRLAPATFTRAGSALTIDLNSAAENISFSTDGTTITAVLTGGVATDPGATTGGTVNGLGTSTATIASASYTSIAVTDSGLATSVSFANSTGSYPQSFNINLNGPSPGDIKFAGASTFGASVTAATTLGFFASTATSSLTLTGAANLSLTTPGDILMQGAITVAGTTAFSGNVIQADNAGNDFVGAVGLTATTVVALTDANALTLAASNWTYGGLALTTRITAGGNITQTGALTASATASTTLAFTSTGGSITLSNAGNSFASNTPVGLSVTGANTATLVNSPTTVLNLDDITLGTGLLSITAAGNIAQPNGTTIQTGGAITTTTTTNNKDVTLNRAGNKIAGIVTAVESGAGFLRNYSLRNSFDNATLPTGVPFTTANDIQNLTLYFDNNGMALPGYSITGNLTVTAGGDITQTAGLTVAGLASFAILGDFATTLTNAANALSGGASFIAPQSTQPIQIVNAGPLVLGVSDVGRGSFSATTTAGTLTSVSAITQHKGSPGSTFTAAGGTISLTGQNDFTAPTTFAGAGLTTVAIVNNDPQAQVNDIVIPASVTSLNIQFNNAGAVLPAYNLSSLTVGALGISEGTGTGVKVTGQATFSAGTYPILLPNPANDFNNVTLFNSGRNDVTIADVNAIGFSGNSTLGTGRLTVTAGGAITEPGGGLITQAATGPTGDVKFSSTGGAITLGGNNQFVGSFSASVSGANNASVTNSGTLLTLGTVSTGAGSFTATDGAEGIVQAPTSALALNGPSTFTSAGSVTLTGRSNSFVGAVALNAAGASLRASGGVILGTSAVTGSLSVKTGGSAGQSVTQAGAITGNMAASFDVGASDVSLTNAANNFANVSITSTGAASSVTDSNGISVNTIKLGAGSLTINAGGAINETAGGALVQTGAGALTLTTPAASNVNLSSTNNVINGAVTITGSKNVTMRTQGNLTFAGPSVITGNFTPTAGGVLTLPTNLTTFSALTASANSTTVGSDVTATGAISFAGTVNFSGGRILNAGGNVAFTGDVTAGGPLTFNMPAAGTVTLNEGVWTQGVNTIAVNGAGAILQIGNSATKPARLIAGGGTIAFPSGGDLTVQSDGTLQVGTNPAAAETEIIANGSGTVTFNGTLAVGFGATNDRLVVSGTGPVVLTANAAKLVGTGIAAAAASPVLTSQTAALAGRFINSADASDNPHDFFAGSDIVTPNYSFTDVTVKAGGVGAPSGTATGFLPDGDKFTVKSSLAGAALLTTVVDLSGHLDVVVRNTSSAAASTLTISTTGGGDGFIPVGGVAVNTPGAVSISAPTSDFTGNLTTAGTLTALTARDIGVLGAFQLNAGGPATGKTALTARLLRNSTINLAGVLGSLKAVSTLADTITAQSFGTLTTTGNKLLADPGAFSTDLISTTTSTGVGVKSATVAGALSGTWDVRGSVATVKSFNTANWILSPAPGANIHNGGLLTSASSLTLGPVASSIINVLGAVTTLTASDVNLSNITAGSFGTVKTVPNTTLALDGNFTNSTMTANGNVANVGIKSLSIAGDLGTGSTVTLLNGDATSIVVGHTVNTATIAALDNGTLGNIKSLTASKLATATVNARTIGTLTVKANLPANLFGDVAGSAITARGNTAGVGLGTFSSAGSVASSVFDVQSGNLTKFTVARQLGSTTIKSTDPAFGAFGTIQAGEWTSGVNVLAKTITTVASVGAAAVLPASLQLLGGIASDNITAYLDTATGPAIKTLTTKGDFNGTFLNAERGIATVTIGRLATSSFLIADDAVAGDINVGRITTLTAGAWNNTTAATTTLGTVKITGYATPESPTASYVFGDVSSGTFTAAGSTPTKPVGIGSFTIARQLQANSFIKAAFGITTLTVGGALQGSSQVVTDNPGLPAAGFLTTLSAGEINGATVRTGSIGAVKVIGNVGLALLGSITNSTISADGAATTPTGPVAIGTVNIAGDYTDSTLDAPLNVGTLSVAGRLTVGSGPTRVLAGYAAGNKLSTLTAGAWGIAGNTTTTDLSTNSLGSFAVKGNTGRGFAGTVDAAFVDILGSSAGIGLGTFSSTGTITNSLFRVSDGDVTSFSTLRFVDSDLLVGYRPIKGSDITLAPAAANWTVTNHKIGSFTTTAPFDVTNPTDTASFANSTVVAAILGTVSLSGVDPVDPTATTFGVAFRTAAGASAKGTVKKDGGAVLAAPTVAGQFNYLGLAG